MQIQILNTKYLYKISYTKVQGGLDTYCFVYQINQINPKPEVNGTWINFNISMVQSNLLWIAAPCQSCSSVLAACFLSSFAQNIVVVLCRVWDIYIYINLNSIPKMKFVQVQVVRAMKRQTSLSTISRNWGWGCMHKADFIERRRTVLDSQRFGKIILDKNLELLNISRYLDLIPFCNES